MVPQNHPGQECSGRPAHDASKDNEKKLNHWACCCGRPVFGFRGVFTEVPFDAPSTRPSS
jgi:hypothetical protein